MYTLHRKGTPSWTAPAMNLNTDPGQAWNQL